MEEVNNFGMKNSLTLPSLANKYFNSLSDENDEPIYSYTDPFERSFLRNSIQVGKCNAFNQHNEFVTSGEVFNIISQKSGIEGNVCDIVDKFYQQVNEYEERPEKEYDLQFEDYHDIDQKEKEKYSNNNVKKIKFHNQLSKLDLNNTQMSFDATSLYPYPRAMYDEKSVYHEIETDYAFKPQSNDIFVNDFINKTFHQDGIDSAIFKIKYYNPTDLVFQHLPVKEKGEKNIRMRKGYVNGDTLASVDICKIVKMGGKVIIILRG